MTTDNLTVNGRQWQQKRLIRHPALRYGLIVLAVAYVFWSAGTLEINWTRFSNGMPRAVNMFSRMFPPDFSRWSLLVKGLLESIQMALAASFFGMILALPLGICGAGNLVSKPIYYAARGIIILSRTFHEIIIAIFL